MRITDVLSRSDARRAAKTVHRRATNSSVVAMLGREDVIKGLVGAVVLFSVVSVLGSNLGAAIKFSSFLVLFTVISAIGYAVVELPKERL
jgi:hypothetical protein